MPRPQPTDGDAYLAYALISNALAGAFQDAGLFVRLSRREQLAEQVWDSLCANELAAPERK